MNDEYLIYGETLTAIADSIRSVSSVSTTWTPDEMAAYILANLVKPTSRQAAKTYTPGTSNQTIPAGTFLTGAATIAGDSDLAVGNIKKGVNIFGKTGTLSGIWGDASSFSFTAVKTGSFTVSDWVAKSNQYYTFTHNLGVKPKLLCYYANGTVPTPSYNTTGVYSESAVTFYPLSGTTRISTVRARTSSGGLYTSDDYDGSLIADSTTQARVDHTNAWTDYPNNSGALGGLYPGITYKWLVIG